MSFSHNSFSSWHSFNVCLNNWPSCAEEKLHEKDKEYFPGKPVTCSQGFAAVQALPKLWRGEKKNNQHHQKNPKPNPNKKPNQLTNSKSQNLKWIKFQEFLYMDIWECWKTKQQQNPTVQSCMEEVVCRLWWNSLESKQTLGEKKAFSKQKQHLQWAGQKLLSIHMILLMSLAAKEKN